MKVPISWLREYVDGLPSTDEVAERIRISGTEVDAIEPWGVPAGGDALADGQPAYVVGKVVTAEPHPNADKLSLCSVDIGRDEPAQIVCGAPNVAAGQAVAVVLPGGRIPGGHEIGVATLRGVESSGMILSERELGISEDHGGIMVLADAPDPGAPVATLVPLRDDVLELEITSNRPDCLGVYGVAREVAATLDLPLAEIDVADATPDEALAPAADTIAVDVSAPDLCPRYMLRTFENVAVGPSPPWLKQRLTAAGMRPISNVVDITNYVMLLTGQPLHAFDADKLEGSTIIVRRAGEGEPVTTLDGERRTLRPDDLVIADGDRPAVIAGIMGAADVEVSANTRRVALEAAAFSGRAVMETSARLGLRSESSGRFEKGLSPHLPPVALSIASRLLVELCGARMAPGTVDVVSASGLDTSPTISFDPALATRTLGFDIDSDEVRSILVRLGYEVVPAANHWTVEVPHWRMYDTTRPIDLVEEIGRIAGLDRVPTHRPTGPGGGLTQRQRLTRTLEDSLAALGFQESVTYSLRAAGAGTSAGVPADEVVTVHNPMTRDHAELRTSLIPSLLEIVAANRRVGGTHLMWFERGRAFRRGDGADPLIPGDGTERFVVEREVLTLVAGGSERADHTGAGSVPVDVPWLRAVLDQIGALAGVNWRVRRSAPDAVPAMFHPARTGEIGVGGRSAGWYGELHPTPLKELSLPAGLVCAQVDLDTVFADGIRQRTYDPISNFPASSQDIAVVVPTSVSAGDILGALVEAGIADLEHARIFDRYEGSPIPEGSYSLAVRLSFRAHDRTLEDAEVDERRTAAVEILAARFGATLREAGS